MATGGVNLSGEHWKSAVENSQSGADVGVDVLYHIPVQVQRRGSEETKSL